jgi:superfamily II DNA or RNA helicase
MDSPVLTPWDVLQHRAIARITDALKSSDKVVAVAPTGFGKTKLSRMLIQSLPGPKAFYTHRKNLFDQTHNSFLKDGISHGCRASDYRDYYFPDRETQLCMLPSERVKVMEKQQRQLHNARWVFVDEAHANTDDFTRWAIEQHVAQGAKVIGLTATPVGLGGMYDSLVELARLSELRKAKGVLMAEVYAPDEVDLSDVTKVSVDGEFSQAQLGRRFAVQQVVGRVYEWWLKVNPNQLPALGFAPGVEESRWFCDEFMRRGVPAAHIDGEAIYLGEKRADGSRVLLPSTQKNRDMLRDMSKSGEVKVVWNRYVMRVGVDWPHLGHLIFATAFATEEAWVQSCGRGLRADPDNPSLTRVLVTDHGGNVWRPGLGSPNADRVWTLNDTNSSRAKAAKQDIVEGDAQEPVNCPTCRRPIDWKVWKSRGERCPFCGEGFNKSMRWVQQTNGNLKPVSGAVTPKRTSLHKALSLIDSLFYGAKNGKKSRGLTFKQIQGLFHGQLGHLYRIEPDPKTRVTVVRDRETGETAMVRNMPHSDSGYMNYEVRATPQEHLQGVRYGQGKRTEADHDGGGVPDGALFQAEEA